MPKSLRSRSAPLAVVEPVRLTRIETPQAHYQPAPPPVHPQPAQMHVYHHHSYAPQQQSVYAQPEQQSCSAAECEAQPQGWGFEIALVAAGSALAFAAGALLTPCYGDPIAAGLGCALAVPVGVGVSLLVIRGLERCRGGRCG